MIITVGTVLLTIGQSHVAGVQNPNEVAQNGFRIVPLLEDQETNGRKCAFSEIQGAQSATDARYRYPLLKTEA